MVQPFTLPKNQHIVFESKPTTPSTPNEPSNRPYNDPSVNTSAIDETTPYAEFTPLTTEDLADNSSEFHDDQDMEEVLPASLQPTRGVPKTMAELAAEASAQQGEANEEHLSKPSDEYRPSPASKEPIRSPSVHVNGRASRTQAGTSSRSSGGITTTTKAKAASNSKKRRLPTRKRGRSGKMSESSEDNEDNVRSPPIKRLRGHGRETAIPVSDRVLRTRRSKTAAQTQEG